MPKSRSGSLIDKTNISPKTDLFFMRKFIYIAEKPNQIHQNSLLLATFRLSRMQMHY